VNYGRALIRLVLAFVALFVAQMIVGMLIHPSAPSMPDAMKWMMLSNAVMVLALGLAALRSDWRDWRLARALFFVPAAITLADMIEGVFFLKNSHIDWRGVTAFTLASYAVAALLWWLIFRGAPVVEAAVESGLPHRSLGQIAWRVMVCAACYVVLYFVTGSIIFPYVRDFYATQQLPSFGQIVAMQFLVRGPIFMLVCIVLLRMFRMTGVASALAVGLAFTALSGVAPLIIPNPYFPDSVRWVHFCEVTSENFVFGAVVAWVWGHVSRVRQVVAAHA
jgi:hypothetical protein